MLNLRLNSLKRLILFFLILISNLIFSDNVQAQNKGKIKTVVIDAGHGGKDPGAVGKKAKEKDITLSVAKMTGDYIKQHCPDVNVVYTRSGDTFVSLLRRAQIANEKNADLFFAYGPLGKEMVRGAEAMAYAKHFATHEELVASLKEELQPGDSLLVKGSRGMHMEKVLQLLFANE